MPKLPRFAGWRVGHIFPVLVKGGNGGRFTLGLRLTGAGRAAMARGAVAGWCGLRIGRALPAGAVFRPAVRGK